MSTQARKTIRKPIADYPAHLRGFGHSPMTRPRGLRGGSYGAASKGRRLSAAERAVIEQQLRDQGRI